jgi:Rrf2 family protein
VKGEVLGLRQDLSVKFLEQILAELRKAGIVSSQRGADGGYWLAKPAAEITVADVVRAVEGPLADVRGMPPDALEYPAPTQAVRDLWVATRAALRSVLEVVTIAELASGSLSGLPGALVADPDAWVRRAWQGWEPPGSAG